MANILDAIEYTCVDDCVYSGEAYSGMIGYTLSDKEILGSTIVGEILEPGVNGLYSGRIQICKSCVCSSAVAVAFAEGNLNFANCEKWEIEGFFSLMHNRVSYIYAFWKSDINDYDVRITVEADQYVCIL